MTTRREGWGRDDRGQAMTALSLVVALGLLALGVLGFLRLSNATDDAGSVQNAADAAALAGAQAIANDAPGQLLQAIKHGKDLPGGLGAGEASDFASRNGASVTFYHYDPTVDRIDVTVVNKKATEAGLQHATTTSAARLGLRLGPCHVPSPPPAPTPTPTPTPTSTSTASPTPTPTPTPPDVTDEIVCGDLTVPIIFPGDGGDPIIKINASVIKDQLKPRLTS